MLVPRCNSSLMRTSGYANRTEQTQDNNMMPRKEPVGYLVSASTGGRLVIRRQHPCAWVQGQAVLTARERDCSKYSESIGRASTRHGGWQQDDVQWHTCKQSVYGFGGVGHGSWATQRELCRNQHAGLGCCSELCHLCRQSALGPGLARRECRGQARCRAQRDTLHAHPPWDT
jgi:hypothetical protein